VVKTPGPHGFYTFVPEPIPRKVPLGPETVVLLSETDRALGRLAGAGRLLLNPHLLVQPYVVTEALASSRIEGTQASVSDVFDAAARGRAYGDVLEVTNYIAALSRGLELLPSLPISMRLISEVHRLLLTGVRGEDRQPGETRRSPNWIGGPEPSAAVFVPPPVDELGRLLTDWERFVHDRVRLPPLVKCALLHYQFETIHPFLDGNGRLGRLLIVFYLVEQQLLPQPLLYISAYFEARRDEYYDRLQAVRERGELDAWIDFFLEAVRVQATDALSRAEQLTDVRAQLLEQLAGTRSRAREVVDLLFENPIVTASYVSDRLGMTHQGAANLIRQLAEAGIVEEFGRVPGGATTWASRRVLEIIEGAAP
jgi:Fic family protein